MKLHEIIQPVKEIGRIPKRDFEGGKSILYQYRHAPSKKEKIPLPGSSGLFYSVDNKTYETVIFIWDPKTSDPIGMLYLEKRPAFPIPNAMRVETITVDEDYRGRRIGLALYGIALSILKIPLLAGDVQTPDGRKMWNSIAQIPGVQMKGYVLLFDNQIDDEISHVLQNKLKAKVLDKSKVAPGTYYVFDVAPSTTKQQIQAVVKTKLSKIYDNEDYTTGLYAIWNGGGVQESVFENLNLFESTVNIDNVNGWGAVPYNQEVDYFGLRVQMTPSTFLRLAAPLGNEGSTEIFDHIKSGGSIASPFLQLSLPADWENGNFSTPAKVIGHEGRNRMKAIAKLYGDDNPIEVHLLFTSGVRARHLTPEIRKELKAGLVAEKSTTYIRGPLFAMSHVD